MISYDKIRKNVNQNVLLSINKLVRNNDVEKLKTWITELETEITRKKENKEEVSFAYYCELEYLKVVLGGFKCIN